LPPLNTTLARRMMEQTKIFAALQGVRGRKPVDILALEQLLVRFSELVVEQRWIKEIDINPLLVSAERLVALDARVVVHGPEMTEDKLPRTAIRPYPNQYVQTTKMKDGTPITIRPIRPEDEPLMVKFHQTLSERSVYFRYFHMINVNQRTAHERLTRICFNDYDRQIALVVERKDPREILAVGRLSRVHGKNEAEFAILVSDLYQRRGLGTKLLRALVEIGRKEKMQRISAEILPENLEMQAVCEKVGFALRSSASEGVVHAEIKL
jgi:acetyltransferase